MVAALMAVAAPVMLVPVIIAIAVIIMTVIVAPLAPLVFSPLLFAKFPAQVFLPLVRLMKFMPPVVCLRAAVPVVLNSLMLLPVGAGNLPVAVVPIIGFRTGRSGK
jgi:hypothetical protein